MDSGVTTRIWQALTRIRVVRPLPFPLRFPRPARLYPRQSLRHTPADNSGTLSAVGGEGGGGGLEYSMLVICHGVA
jgi:hypothetical protein